MADQSDVENALVALAANALYPNGSSSPSLPGPDCRIYRGWPNSAALNADLAAGVINVTVFPQGEPGRNTTRYSQQWQGFPAQATLTASVSGVSVTIGGTAGPGQLAGMLVNDSSYVYASQAGDTPATVAANLATAVRTDWIVNLSGATLTIPGAGSVLARVVADASVMQEVRRQERGFRITCWCPTPATRDASASAIDLLLVGFQFINLADSSQGRLQYRGTLVFDQSQDALLYRRDLLYDVEYPTTITARQPAMLFGELVLNAGTFTA
ncbi:MAG: hypothetical protein ABSC95_03575 [Acetobacteraceae bacterium]|jgi:hypothetical protein